MMTSLYSKLLPGYIGIHIGSGRIIIYAPYKGIVKELLIEEVTQVSKDDYLLIDDCFAFILSLFRRRFKRWPPIKSFISYDKHSYQFDSVCFNKLADKYNLEIIRLDAFMVLAVGIGISVTDEIKSIILVATNDTLYGLVIFCSNIFFEVKQDIEDNLKEASSNIVSTIEGMAEDNLPNVFNRLGLSEEDLSRIANGWRNPFNNEIHLVLDSYFPDSKIEKIKEYRVISHESLYEGMKSGMSVFEKHMDELEHYMWRKTLEST